MDRLTNKNGDGCYVKGSNGKSWSDNQGRIYGEHIDKLAKYEDMEEQGLLIKLPCKVGDKFFRIVKDCDKCGKHHYDEYWEDERCDYDFDNLPKNEQSTYEDIENIGKHCCLDIEEVPILNVQTAFNLIRFFKENKTVFRTKEETVQKIKELQKNEK